MKPNIILINCDDLGYGDLGCYGSTVNATPHIDRLAAEGTRLTDFYMASPVCSPSRCAMMTGCYPPRIGCASFDGGWVLFPGAATGLNPEEKTVARQLKDLGYATALVGKWHCGDQPAFLPTRHGFDHYYGLPYSNDMGMMHVRSDCKVPLPLMRDDTVIQEQPDQTGLTERYVEESIRFIREHQTKPFFLYLAHMHVHLPLLVSERFMKDSANGPYGGAVACIDWAMGALMAELQRLGLDDNTLIVFTSDNGSRGDNGGSNAPLRGIKGRAWEGGMRLPCIVRWPGQVPAGRVSSSITSAIDFLPTFLALAGGRADRSKTIDGLDHSAHWLGRETEGPRDTFFYYVSEDLYAVRQGLWKYFARLPDTKPENQHEALFNLDDDIGETTDRLADHPEVAGRLRGLMEECRRALGDASRGVTGTECRPNGRVENPVTLTAYDPDHPYMIAMYDGKAG